MFKFVRILDAHFEEFFCALMLGYIAISLNIEVFNRYIFLSPSAFTDEIARMFMLFIVFLGVPWAVLKNRHIVIDLWPPTISPKKTLVLDLISSGCFLIFAVIFTSAAYDAMEFHKMLGSKTQALEFQYWIQLSMLPFAFALTCIRLIQKIYFSVETYKEAISSELTNHKEL